MECKEPQAWDRPEDEESLIDYKLECKDLQVGQAGMQGWCGLIDYKLECKGGRL